MNAKQLAQGIVELKRDVIDLRGHRALRRDGVYMEVFNASMTLAGPFPFMRDVFEGSAVLERLDRRMLKEQTLALWHGCSAIEGVETRKCFAHSQSMDCPVGFGAQVDNGTNNTVALRCWMPFRSVDVDNKFLDDVLTGLWIADEIARIVAVQHVEVKYDLFNAHYKV